MSSSQSRNNENPQRSRRKRTFIILIYPFTLALIAAGFAAFFLLILNFSVHLAATVALGFFGFTSTGLYFVSKPAIEQTDFKFLFMNMVMFADIFGALTLITYLYSYFA